MNSSTSSLNKYRICWYDKYKGLHGSILSKARKFNRLGLIKRLGGCNWQIDPLPGNSLSYIIIRDCNIMKCQCQQNKIRGAICSHILAIELWEENKHER